MLLNINKKLGLKKKVPLQKMCHPVFFFIPFQTYLRIAKLSKSKEEHRGEESSNSGSKIPFRLKPMGTFYDQNSGNISINLSMLQQLW